MISLPQLPKTKKIFSLSFACKVQKRDMGYIQQKRREKIQSLAVCSVTAR